MVTLGGVYLLSPGFFQPYRTPLGQVILAVLLVLYLGSLILMRRKAQQRTADRGSWSEPPDDHVAGAAGRHPARRRSGVPGRRGGAAVPRLDAALERVGVDGPDSLARLADLGTVTKPSERLGALLYRITPVPLTERQRRALRLQDKPIAEFYADKAVMMIIGALLPGLVGFVWTLVRRLPRLLAGPAVAWPERRSASSCPTCCSAGPPRAPGPARWRPCSSTSTW